MKRIYLDAAAGAVGNPSSPHEEGRRAKKVLEDARTAIARLLEVQADDVVFTSGATESNALAILGHVRALRELAGKDAVGRNNMHVLYLPSAHASIVSNVALLAEEGIAAEPLPIKDWRVDTDALTKMIRTETVLVTMEAVCGETGVVWNTREVAEAVKRGGVAAALHVDASQAPMTEKVTRAHFGADLVTFDGAKLGVPGIGVLVAHRTIPVQPFYRGGEQERALHPGTEQPKRAAECAARLRRAAHKRDTFAAAALRDRSLLIALFTAAIPDVLVNAGLAQAPNILNISLPGRDTDYLVALLDEAGFAVSTKSACETDSLEGSRAVLALTGDHDRAISTLRISWGRELGTRVCRQLSQALTGAVRFVDINGSR